MSASTRLKVIHGHLNGHHGHLRKFSNSIANSKVKSGFRYTLDDTSALDQNQRQFYEQNGYLLIRNLLPHDLLQTFIDHFRDMCNGKVDVGFITMAKDISLAKKGVTGEYLYNKAQDFVWDDVLYEYISYPKIIDIVKSFTGPNIMAVHTMLINKPPDAGTLTSRHPLHQDLHYFPFRPADRIVCSWTAMEKVTRENGCLVVIPESHTGQLYPHDYPKWEDGVNKAYHGIVDQSLVIAESPKVHLEMEKGDTVFFHPLLVHGSGANRTQGFRKAISCHYAASECEYIDVKGTTQENIAQEIEELAKKKGAEIRFKDIWKYRSRLVTGMEVNL